MQLGAYSCTDRNPSLTKSHAVPHPLSVMLGSFMSARLLPHVRSCSFASIRGGSISFKGGLKGNSVLSRHSSAPRLSRSLSLVPWRSRVLEQPSYKLRCLPTTRMERRLFAVTLGILTSSSCYLDASNPKGPDEFFAPLIKTMGQHPIASDIGMGSVAGVATGFVVKQFSRRILVAAGVGIVWVQVLIYHDILRINWRQLDSAWNNVIHQGKTLLGGSDSQRVSRGESLAQLFRDKVPFGGSFVTGLLIGLRF